MHETSPLSLQAPVMPLSEFLPALFQALDGEGVRVCVLRNYEGFPACNTGRDVDLLIRASDLPLAIRALRSIRGIRIVGYFERRYVANVFLEGIASTPKARALQVDFDLSLTWKGLVYLPADAVLQAAVSRSAGNSAFFVPSPVHEAIISLLTSLIVGGSVKKKYFTKVQRTFASERPEVIAALSPQFGVKTATRLADSVIGGDRDKVHGCVRALRTSLVLHNLLRRPFRSALAVARHYACEVALRCSLKTIKTVCILSPASSDEATIIEALMPILQSSAVTVERRHLWPQLPLSRSSSGMNTYADCSAETRHGLFTSMVGIVWWVAKEWLSQFKKDLTLRVVESHFHNLLTDQKWRRYGIPKWFAWLVGKLLPSPDLWILLNPVAEGMQSENHEILPAQKLAQLEACRSFVMTKKRHVILDASQPAENIIMSAYAAIIDMLAQSTGDKLRNRF